MRTYEIDVVSSSVFLITKTNPTAGRFVPPGDVRGWDRYAYVENNPLRYADPSGHYGCEDELCKDPETIGEAQVNVILSRYGNQVYQEYVKFVNAREWRNWTTDPDVDPLIVFMGIVLGREAYPEVYNYVVGQGERDWAAEKLFKSVAVGWFEKWSNHEVVIKVYGKMLNHLDRRMMLFNWMGEGLQSSRFNLDAFSEIKLKGYQETTKFGIEVAPSVFFGKDRDSTVEQGDLWPCWGNQSVMSKTPQSYLYKSPGEPDKDDDVFYMFSALQTQELIE